MTTFHVLGPLTVHGDVDQLTLTGRVARLLGGLLLHRGDVVSVDRLVDLTWPGEPPAKPANALQALMSRARRSLAELGLGGLIETRPPGYLVDVAGRDLDADRFLQLLADVPGVLTSRPATALALLDTALSLWGGTPYVDLAGHPVAVPAVARLEEHHLLARERRVAALLRLGRLDEAVTDAASLSRDEPLRERVVALQMHALFASGRQGDALAAYGSLRERLRDELGVDPSGEVESTYRRILDQDPTLLPQEQPATAGPVPAPAPALPRARTSFVGRDAELAQLRTLVGEHQLVTLVGPGGTGKTRLALELAARLTDDRADGAWFVDLAKVAEGDDVLAAVAAALHLPVAADTGGPTGAPPAALRRRLADHVAQRRLLVVLDNCEHLVDAAAEAAQTLLDAGPGVHVLATSREGLRVPGEVLRPLGPLAVPDEDESLADTLASPAATLLVDRARSIRPDLQVVEEDNAAIVAICRRLDGLPLALELAAARLSSLSVQDLARRLGDRFRLLTGGSRTAMRRQQTLEAVVDWSHDLLDEPHRAVFARAAVFAGGCDLAAAEAVCSADGLSTQDVAGRLGDLVDKSLLIAERGPDGATRYRSLETLRAYALRRLAERDEAGTVRARHAAWVRDLAAAADAASRGPDQLAALARLDTEHDNVLAALEWALDDDPVLLARIATSMAWFWWLRDRHETGLIWLTRARAGADRLPPDLRAATHAWLGFLRSFVHGPDETAVAEAHAALAIIDAAPELGDALAEAVSVTVWPLLMALRLDEVEALLDRAEPMASRLGSPWLLGTILFERATARMIVGRLDEARACSREAREWFREAGDLWGQFQVGTVLAQLDQSFGDYESAMTTGGWLVEVGAQLGMRNQTLMARAAVASCRSMLGDRARAMEELEAVIEDGGDEALPALGFAREVMGTACRLEGDLDAARDWLVDAVARYRALPGGGQWMTGVHAKLAGVAALCGDADVASAHARRSWDAARQFPVPWELAVAVEATASAADVSGDPQAAATLLGAADGLRRAGGTPLPPAERYEVARIEENSRAALGADAYEDLHATGAAVATTDGPTALLPASWAPTPDA